MTATRLGGISAFITKGATPTTYGFKWEMSGVPFLRSECVSEQGLDMRQSMFISPQADQALRRSQVQDGDILMTITGNVGRVIRLAGVGTANINQHIARIRVNDRRFDAGYVYHYLSQRTMREFYETIVTGQAYPQISLAQVRDTSIPVLPLAEQREIAAALDNADDWIATLKQRIVKKQAIKQGMMQQLLTGRTRLPGFVHPWQKRRLTEIVAGLEAGVSVRSVATSSGGPSILKTSAVEQGRFIPGEAKPILEADRSRARCSPIAGSMIISRMNTPALVGEVGYVAESHPDLFLPDRLWLVRSKTSAQADMRWLTYLFASEPGARLLRGLATGTSGSMKNIPKDRVLGLEIPTPDPTEQEAISAVLADADCEIGRLNARLAKTRDIKTGMVQQLLSGRVRLPAEVAT